MTDDKARFFSVVVQDGCNPKKRFMGCELTTDASIQKHLMTESKVAMANVSSSRNSLRWDAIKAGKEPIFSTCWDSFCLVALVVE